MLQNENVLLCNCYGNPLSTSLLLYFYLRRLEPRVVIYINITVIPVKHTLLFANY